MALSQRAKNVLRTACSHKAVASEIAAAIDAATAGTNTTTGVGVTTSGVGAAAGTGVTAVENGNGVLHKTVLTLVNTTVTLTANGTSTAGGGLKIYDFPEGEIKVLGVTSNLTVANAGGDGSFLASVGTVAAASDGSLSSTEANIAASTAATVSSNVGTCKIKGDTVAALDGTSTAIDAYLNSALNADGTGKLSMAFSGTITIHWVNLGDN